MADTTSSASTQVRSDENPRSPKKSIAKNFTDRRVIFVMTITIVMLIALGMSLFLRQFASVLDGIVISLLTSLIFTLFYVVIVEDDMRDAQREEQRGETQQLVTAVKSQIDLSLSDVLKSVMISLADHLSPEVLADWKNLLPVKSFPPSDIPLDSFAKRIADNVTSQSCKSYVFRGGTGQRCAAWLAKINDSALDCKILILDPRDQTAIQVHALDRIRADSDGKVPSLPEVIDDIRIEIANGISELYALKKPFRIYLRVCTDKLFCRAEIFDEEAIVSFLTTDRSKYYPAAHVYTKKSAFYNAIRQDFSQSWNNTDKNRICEFVISPTSTSFDRDDTLKELELLQKHSTR